jgi:hypothetical protein
LGIGTRRKGTGKLPGLRDPLPPPQAFVFGTIMKVTRALGLKLTVTAA